MKKRVVQASSPEAEAVRRVLLRDLESVESINVTFEEGKATATVKYKESTNLYPISSEIADKQTFWILFKMFMGWLP